MVFYFSYFNIHKKLKKKIQIFLRQTINGSFKNIKLPNSYSYFFMEGHNNLMSASPMLMWRPDISLKKLLLDLLVQLGTSGNCVWALMALFASP